MLYCKIITIYVLEPRHSCREYSVQSKGLALTRTGAMGLLRGGECRDSRSLVPSMSDTGLSNSLPESGLLSLSGVGSMTEKVRRDKPHHTPITTTIDILHSDKKKQTIKIKKKSALTACITDFNQQANSASSNRKIFYMTLTKKIHNREQKDVLCKQQVINLCTTIITD